MNLATKFFYFQYRHPNLGRISAKLMRILFSCDVYTVQRMGNNNSLEHNGLGIVISRMTVMGSNCKIYQHVTIGAGRGGIRLSEIMSLFIRIVRFAEKL